MIANNAVVSYDDLGFDNRIRTDSGVCLNHHMRIQTAPRTDMHLLTDDTVSANTHLIPNHRTISDNRSRVHHIIRQARRKQLATTRVR